VRRAIAELVPYTNNARTHSDTQVAQLARSIEEFGFTVPILVDTDGVVIAGHGRLLAAKRLGIAEVPVMVATGWSEAQVRAYCLGYNQDDVMETIKTMFAAYHERAGKAAATVGNAYADPVFNADAMFCVGAFQQD
jgi:ParB-like nuclease domain